MIVEIALGIVLAVMIIWILCNGLNILFGD